MKKLFAVLLALTLVLSMGITAFAADTGTITITNAVPGETYTIYKMLDFEPTIDDAEKGVYKATKDWVTFFSSGGSQYFDSELADGQSFEGAVVTLKEGADIEAAAVNAADYVKYVIPGNFADEKTADSSTVEFTGLDLGYYFVKTSTGTFAALTNTNSDFTAIEKNSKPDISKQVQEDADNSWGTVNDAQIGQDVNYKSVITVGVGAVDYVMHDKMEAGLTFNNDVVVSVDGVLVDANYYTVTVDPDDGDTFDVSFENAYIASLEQGKEIVVTYSAKLNENATIGEEDGNDNTVKLAYNDETSIEHKTSTYTWKIDVFKFAKEGDNQIALSGAKFQLFDNNHNLINFTQVTEGVTVPTYKVDPNGTINVIVTDENGEFAIIGLDEGAYKLHETEAPAGYNKLAGPVDVTITSVHNDDEYTATYKVNDATPATIEVENKTGGLLPETGGIGTTIFYIVGGMLMVAAVVFLVTKKRMSAFA